MSIVLALLGALRADPRLLRQHRPRAADGAGEAKGLRPEGAQAAAQVAASGCDGRGALRGDGLRDAAGRGHLASALEHLPALPRCRVGAAALSANVRETPPPGSLV